MVLSKVDLTDSGSPYSSVELGTQHEDAASTEMAKKIEPKKREALWSKIVQAAQQSGTQPEGRQNWPQENRIKGG